MSSNIWFQYRAILMSVEEVEIIISAALSVPLRSEIVYALILIFYKHLIADTHHHFNAHINFWMKWREHEPKLKWKICG